MTRLFVGAMSGTSCDGVDAAVVAVEGIGRDVTAKYVRHVEGPFGDELRRRLVELRAAGGGSFDEISRIERDVTNAYVEAVREVVRDDEVEAIGAHGQTLLHEPPRSWQAFDPSLLAAAVKRPVVSDFRRADLAAGGQGAPLVPLGDWVFFRDAARSRIILNLGGVANLTYLPAGGDLDDVVAFDTGPGCCLSDWICRERLGESYDRDGAYAASGNGGLLTALAWMEEEPYPQQPPPKSTDVPALIERYRAYRDASRSPADELSAAAALVATTVVEQIVLHLPESTGAELYVAGGGANNAAILSRLTEAAAAYRLTPPRRLDELGLPAQAREAACFALLAAARVDGVPNNVPRATGARAAVVGGSITSAP
jgi:anhydro-N-acetylmuramic acid kinase